MTKKAKVASLDSGAEEGVPKGLDFSFILGIFQTGVRTRFIYTAANEANIQFRKDTLATHDNICC